MRKSVKHLHGNRNILLLNLIFFTHHAAIRTTICGFAKCLIDQHFVPYNTTSNHQTNGKRHRQRANAHGFNDFIIAKMKERTSEDSLVFPARGQNIKMLLSYQFIVTTHLNF